MPSEKGQKALVAACVLGMWMKEPPHICSLAQWKIIGVRLVSLTKNSTGISVAVGGSL